MFFLSIQSTGRQTAWLTAQRIPKNTRNSLIKSVQRQLIRAGLSVMAVLSLNFDGGGAGGAGDRIIDFDYGYSQSNSVCYKWPAQYSTVESDSGREGRLLEEQGRLMVAK